jgi:hypothetical protein
MISSPCKDCEHAKESKLTFPACVNCIKRFGTKTAFLVSDGYVHKKKCKWPHGCDNTTVKADYCSDHCSLIGARKAYWKNKGLTPEQLDAKLFAPKGKVGGQKRKIKERK